MSYECASCRNRESFYRYIKRRAERRCVIVTEKEYYDGEGDVVDDELMNEDDSESYLDYGDIISDEDMKCCNCGSTDVMEIDDEHGTSDYVNGPIVQKSISSIRDMFKKKGDEKNG